MRRSPRDCRRMAGSPAQTRRSERGPPTRTSPTARVSTTWPTRSGRSSSGSTSRRSATESGPRGPRELRSPGPVGPAITFARRYAVAHASGAAAGSRSLRSDGDDREHACLEVARDVADEEIGARLGEIDGARLGLPRVDVVAVADEID